MAYIKEDRLVNTNYLLIDNYNIAKNAINDFQNAYSKDDNSEILIEARTVLQMLVKANNYQVFYMGAVLFLIKQRLNHGEFSKWIESISLFSHRTANNYMNVYKYCLGNPVLLRLEKRNILEEICKPNFPDTIRRNIVKLLHNGFNIYNKKELNRIKELNAENSDNITNDIVNLHLMETSQKEYDQLVIKKIEKTINYNKSAIQEISSMIEYHKRNMVALKKDIDNELESKFVSALRTFNDKLENLREEYECEDSVTNGDFFCKEIRLLEESFFSESINHKDCPFKSACTTSQWIVRWSIYTYDPMAPFSNPYPYYPAAEAIPLAEQVAPDQNGSSYHAHIGARSKYNLELFKDKLLEHFIEVSSEQRPQPHEEMDDVLTEEEMRTRLANHLYSQLGPDDFLTAEFDENLAKMAERRFAECNLGPSDFLPQDDLDFDELDQGDSHEPDRNEQTLIDDIPYQRLIGFAEKYLF